jgi:ribonuclease VapC
MIVDTSALIAILRKEQGYQSFIETLLKADRVRISAATLLESRMVAHRDNGLAELAELLVTLDAEIIAVDQAQTDVAFQGFLRYGKGQHPFVIPPFAVLQCLPSARANSRPRCSNISASWRKPASLSWSRAMASPWPASCHFAILPHRQDRSRGQSVEKGKGEDP